MAQTRVACAAQPSSSAHGASIFSKLDQGLPSIEDVLHDIRSEESTLENLANVALGKTSFLSNQQAIIRAQGHDSILK